MVSAAVLTVTAGRKVLERCIQSVRAQTHPCKHYIFCDHAMSFGDYAAIRAAHPECSVSWWDAKAGGPGLEGRRLYAAASGLMDEDAIFMLNDDDWYEPGHVQSLVALIEQGNDWAFSLRKIYDVNGEYLFDDDCEALGTVPVWTSPDYNPFYLVEHSAFAVRRDLFNRLRRLFNYRGHGVDRLFTEALMQNHPNYKCSGIASLCYSLGGNPGSVQKEFFVNGNAHMKRKYPHGFPWKKPPAS